MPTSRASAAAGPGTPLVAVDAGRATGAEHVRHDAVARGRHAQADVGSPAADRDDRGVASGLVAQQGGRAPTQQPRRLERDGLEDLIGVHPARHELRNVPQRGLLVGQQTQLGARLGVGDRGGDQLGEARDARLGVVRERLLPRRGREADAPHATVHRDRDAHRRADGETARILDERFQDREL
jgi:hypothetical protein